MQASHPYFFAFSTHPSVVWSYTRSSLTNFATFVYSQQQIQQWNTLQASHPYFFAFSTHPSVVWSYTRSSQLFKHFNSFPNSTLDIGFHLFFSFILSFFFQLFLSLLILPLSFNSLLFTPFS